MKNTMIAIVAVAGLTAAASAQTGYGVTRDNRIVSFDAATPGTIVTNAAISGLAPDERVLSIDARPASLSGQLVILTSASKLYSVDAAGNTLALGPAFTPALGAAEYSIDFNPTVDRIRTVGGVGGAENFRLNPVNGSRVAGDTALSFAAGGAPNAVGVAYRFWNFGVTAPLGSVREYIINSTANGLSLAEIGTQAGGNASFNGGLTTTIGALNVIAGDQLVGFDIFGPTDQGFVSANGALGTTLYSVDLTSGAATPIGLVGVTIADVTFVPGPGAAAVLGLGGLLAARRRR